MHAMRFAYVTIFVKITFFFLPYFYFAAGHLTGFAAAVVLLLVFEFESCPRVDMSGFLLSAGASFVSDLSFDRHPCV